MMRTFLRTLLLLAVAVPAAVLIAGLWYARETGLRAAVPAAGLEAWLASVVRSVSIPPAARARQNPVALSPEVLADGRAHFADHCAVCHANDGSGETEMGRNMYPRAPDMRHPATQNLSDGELFWIIENGIRFTGMPGWSAGAGGGEEATWHLVHFIRHLPQMTPEDIADMEALNPRSIREVREELENERFLRGEDSSPAGHAH